jgi:hypothetical protein
MASTPESDLFRNQLPLDFKFKIHFNSFFDVFLTYDHRRQWAESRAAGQKAQTSNTYPNAHGPGSLCRSCSAFRDLPVELILGIADYLPYRDQQSMPEVCTKFRTIFARYLKTSLERPYPSLIGAHSIFRDRQDKERRLQDQYEPECAIAPPDSELHRLGCLGCRTTHLAEQFSPIKLQRLPEHRICKALEGTIKLCPHASFSSYCCFRALRLVRNGYISWRRPALHFTWGSWDMRGLVEMPRLLDRLHRQRHGRSLCPIAPGQPLQRRGVLD